MDEVQWEESASAFQSDRLCRRWGGGLIVHGFRYENSLMPRWWQDAVRAPSARAGPVPIACCCHNGRTASDMSHAQDHDSPACRSGYEPYENGVP